MCWCKQQESVGANMCLYNVILLRMVGVLLFCVCLVHCYNLGDCGTSIYFLLSCCFCSFSVLVDDFVQGGFLVARASDNVLVI